MKLLKTILIYLALFSLTSCILRINLKYNQWLGSSGRPEIAVSPRILHIGHNTPWVMVFNNKITKVSDQEKTDSQLEYFELLPTTPTYDGFHEVRFEMNGERGIQRLNKASILQISSYLVNRFKFELRGTGCYAPGLQLYEAMAHAGQQLSSDVKEMRKLFKYNDGEPFDKKKSEELTSRLRETLINNAIVREMLEDRKKNDKSLENIVKGINGNFENIATVTGLTSLILGKSSREMSEEVSKYYNKSLQLTLDDLKERLGVQKQKEVPSAEQENVE
jgi:hypothetical protein